MVQIVEYPDNTEGTKFYVYYKNSKNVDIDKLRKSLQKELDNKHIVDVSIVVIPKQKMSEFLKRENKGYFRYDGEQLTYVPHPNDIRKAKTLINMGLRKIIVYDNMCRCDLHFDNGLTIEDVNIKSVPILAFLFLFREVSVKCTKDVYEY